MRALITTLCLLAACSAGAESINTRGGMPCGKWIDLRGPGKYNWGEVWLDGVLTGQAMARRQDLLKDTSPQSLYLWMDTYCRNNPLKSTTDGAAQLVVELQRQQGY